MRKQIDKPEDLFATVEARRAEVGVSGRALGLKAGLSHGTFHLHHTTSGREMSLRAALGYLAALGLRMDVTNPLRRR
jgi:hypothetical protein